MPTPPLSPEKHRFILRLAAEGKSARQIELVAKKRGLGISYGAAHKWMKVPLPEVPDGLPPAVERDYTPFHIGTPGLWLVLSDIHVPDHDRRTIELAVGEAKKRKAVGVILNGDVLDSHEVSDHSRDPRALRYTEEIEVGKELLGWVRKQLPKARIVLKEGNHEERVTRYILSRAPALFGLENTTVPELLHCHDFGIEWVGDKRVIELGRLNVIHGHEYGRGGASSPVNPARGIYLKARSVVMCGHWHRTSEHHERNIRRKSEAAWSLGCACNLAAPYAPLNNWNHGYAMVELPKQGDEFRVENRWVSEVV